MSAAASLSQTDKEFLEQCEEQFKDRYTDKDEEFMKVHNAEAPSPPIVESWWPQNSSRRNDRRFNKRSHPYDNEHDRDSGHEYRKRRHY